MSNQNAAPLSSTSLFLEPATGPLGDPTQPITAHHPKPAPAGYMCTCGKVREACVHDEIRALWGSVGGTGKEGATSKDLGA
jgi:hypothetical protein